MSKPQPPDDQAAVGLTRLFRQTIVQVLGVREVYPALRSTSIAFTLVMKQPWAEVALVQAEERSMEFAGILAQIIALLAREKRLAYRALKLRFHPDPGLRGPPGRPNRMAFAVED